MISFGSGALVAQLVKHREADARIEVRLQQSSQGDRLPNELSPDEPLLAIGFDLKTGDLPRRRPART